jgi:hypothetical protein
MSENRQRLFRTRRYSRKMRRYWKETTLAIIAAALVAFAAYLFLVSRRTPGTIQPPPRTDSVASAPQVSPKPQPIAHIFIIVEENESAGSIIGNSSAPFINALSSQYGLATNYSAVTHPSLPNYIALTSASTDGITTDCNPPAAGCIVNVPNIADEIEAAGKTWKAYAENMPSACYAENSGDYATKHEPFLYYQDISGNPARCAAHVVPYTQLATDLKSAATTPNYAFITPNLCDDMHNCSIATGDAWLAQNVPPILNSAAFKTQPSLLIITWDEGTLSNNSVAAIFAGSAARTAYQSGLAYSHYSLLHTIEDLWGLKPLTANDANAPLMTSFIHN